MMEHTEESFVPLLDELILPKLRAELVQKHLVIELCLHDLVRAASMGSGLGCLCLCGCWRCCCCCC
jgi:hypothetical protein